MSTDDADLADAAEGQEDGAPTPATAHDPAAADKPSDGTASQENQGQNDTTTDPEPTEAEDLERDLRSEFVASEDEGTPADDEQGAKPAGDPPPATGDAPPAEPPQGDDHQPPAKPQEQAADRKPDDPTDKELAGYHPTARARIKNLTKERSELRTQVEQTRSQVERATGAITALEKRAQEAGFSKADELMEGVTLYGRAIHKRDPAAIAEVQKRLGISPAPVSPTLTPDLAAVLAEAETVGIDTSKLRAVFQPSQPPAAPAAPAAPPANPAPPQQQPAVATPAATAQPADVQAAAVAEKALMEEVAAIRAQHGANAPAVIKRVMAEVERIERMAGKLPPDRWKPVLAEVRAQVLAQASAPRNPPRPLRTNANRGNQPASPVDDFEAELRREFVSG